MGHQLHIPAHLRQAFYREAEEEGLLVAARQGDRLAFDELAARVRPQLLAVCLRVLGDEREAEDATQDALALAFEHLSSFEGRSRFSTWAHRIAINAARMRHRKRRPLADSELVDRVAAHTSTLASTPPPAPDRAAIFRAEGRRVHAALDTLEPAARELLLERAVGQTSLEALAKDNGVTRQAIKSRLFRTRARLRAEVGDLLR